MTRDETTDDFFRHGPAGSVAADGLPPLLLRICDDTLPSAAEGGKNGNDK